MTDAEHWDRQAGSWAAFTRGPDPDAYPRYAARFRDLLPAPSGRTLEVGCGEGRVCRDLRAAGHDPVGIDPAPAMIALAREADPTGDYRVADAASLPFADAAFPLVVAYNSLMDIDDLSGAVREIGRVLEPGGRLCACITHPMADSGRFSSDAPDAPFVIAGSYLAPRVFEAAAERNGATMIFRTWARPLETYSRALEDAGLAIELLREPTATAGVPDSASEQRWNRVPNFLFLRARKA